MTVVTKEEIDRGAELMESILQAATKKGFESLEKVLGNIKTMGGDILPIIGFVLEVVDYFFPDDSKHKEIMDAFKKLSDKIDLVRRDIKELEKLIEWESAKQQYTIAVTDLKVGIEYVYGLSTSKDNPARYAEWKNRIINFGRNPALTRAINLLSTGLSGGAELQADILRRLYNVSHGHRPKMITLASRLVAFLCGGLITLMVYEILEHGLDAAKDLMDKLYTHKLVAVHDYVHEMVELPVKEFRRNMQFDLEKGIDDNSSAKNLDIARIISAQVFEKYDWLKLCVMIYGDIQGFDKHCFNGYRVETLHRRKKCGIIYYWEKSKPIENHHRAPEVLQQAKHVADKYSHAREGYNNMERFMSDRKITWSGLAVIKRYVDLWAIYNFKGGMMWHVGRKFTICTILR